MRIVTTILSCFLTTSALAHSWYAGTSDPTTGISCCGTYDCGPIALETVKIVPGGYVYIPTSEFIPHDRAKASRDGEFHRCEFKMDYVRGGLLLHKKGTTRCFYAPPMSG